MVCLCENTEEFQYPFTALLIYFKMPTIILDCSRSHHSENASNAGYFRFYGKTWLLWKTQLFGTALCRIYTSRIDLPHVKNSLCWWRQAIRLWLLYCRLCFVNWHNLARCATTEHAMALAHIRLISATGEDCHLNPVDSDAPAGLLQWTVRMILVTTYDHFQTPYV